MGNRQHLRTARGRSGRWTKAAVAAALAAGLLASPLLNATAASADGGSAATSNAADGGFVDIAPAPSFVDIPGAPVGPFVVRTKDIATVLIRASAGAAVIDAKGEMITTAYAGEKVWLRVDGLPRPARVTIAAAGIYVPFTGDRRDAAKPIVRTDAITFELARDTPALTTVATDKADGDHVLPAAGGTVTAAVTLEGLSPALTHTITGELVDKQTGAGTGITASRTFIPGRSKGTLSLDFAVPSGYHGKVLVAFVTLRDYAGRVASNRDIDSIAQTVSVAPYGTPARPGAPTAP